MGEVNAGHTVQGVEAGDLGDVVVMKVEAGQPRSGLALVTRDRGQPVMAQVQPLEALEAEEVGNRGQSVVRQNQRGQPDVVDPGGLLKCSKVVPFQHCSIISILYLDSFEAIVTEINLEKLGMELK